ncbi:MAG TPA: cupredoxin domain-containing protein [Actinomycetota bacterium]|nr:cupredoxin domain-containing protein [Actinomycetota bacterium]
MRRSHRTARSLRSAAVLGVVAVVVSAPSMGLATESDGDAHAVEAIDNVFTPRTIRVAAGDSVTWRNDGRSPHTVVSDEGAFDSPVLEPGGVFSFTFDQTGAFPYHCSLHGAPGVGMGGLILVGDAPIPERAFAVGPGREEPPDRPGATIRVPQDAGTIQEAVDRAEPGGLVLISPGVYEEAVVVTTPFLTIRGLSRNESILDGRFELDTGISVIEADGVAVENLTARNYVLNGFLWTSVFGYRGSYLTAYNNGDYGVYAYDSVYGQFDRSYAGGHPDSGFYVGQCRPCHAVVTDVLAEHNALGFSGTNAGGELLIVNSEWRDNMSGIVPNTLDSEELAPQIGVLVAGNWVHDNNNADAPAKPLQYPSLGIGIIVNGGRDNVVTHNLVEDHESFGIALLPSPDETLWLTEGNEVRDNLVRRSGRADLTMAAPSGGDDCFAGNEFSTSLPSAIEWRNGCGSWLRSMPGGSIGAVIGPLTRYVEAALGDLEVGDWRSQPVPPPQEEMPGPAQAPPNPAIAETTVPQRVQIRDARALDVPASADVSREVIVLGIPLSAGLAGVFIGLYAYALPFIMYSAWVSIALWDLVRQDAVPNGVRAAWMAGVIAVPVLGPVAYYTLGRSPIQRSLRVMLVAGGIAIYLVLAVVGVALAA